MTSMPSLGVAAAGAVAAAARDCGLRRDRHRRRRRRRPAMQRSGRSPAITAAHGCLRRARLRSERRRARRAFRRPGDEVSARRHPHSNHNRRRRRSVRALFSTIITISQLSIAASACLTACCVVSSDGDDHDDLPHVRRQHARLGRCKQRRRVEDHDAIRITARKLGQKTRHLLACQELGRSPVREPAGRTVSLSMLVLTSASATSISVIRQADREAPATRGTPSRSGNDGCATSPSTSSTVLSTSIATLMARLSAVNVLPSPGNALVTMTSVPLRMRAPDLPRALRRIGRLMTRNSSAIWDFGASGVTNPSAFRRSRSISIGGRVARAAGVPPSPTGAFRSRRAAAEAAVPRPVRRRARRARGSIASGVGTRSLVRFGFGVAAVDESSSASARPRAATLPAASRPVR